MTSLRLGLVILVLGSALVLVGCGAKEGATPLTTTSKPAPPPPNMTPEEKRQYEEAIKQAGPTATPTAAPSSGK